MTRLRLEERARLADVQSLYVYSSTSTQKAPLTMVASTRYAMETQRIRRLEHFRTVTVQGFPVSGAYASQVMNAARPQLTALARDLPPGYQMTIAGAEAKQKTGFTQLGIIMAISISLIFIALVIQFNHLIKPVLVFAAVPYGVVGALAGLWIMGEPFGFMGFLGIASLVGVIVLITVLATLLALVPLAIQGGPLWQPLCYAQIGGLALATFIELLLVKVCST